MSKGRLPSFRSPRDLTLGGKNEATKGSLAKSILGDEKNYLNVARKDGKTKNDPSTSNDKSDRYKVTFTDDHRIRCDICQKTFTVPKNAKQHIETIHSGKIKNIPCKAPGCSKMFKCDRYLYDHMRRSHGISAKDAKMIPPKSKPKATLTKEELLSFRFYIKKESIED